MNFTQCWASSCHWDGVCRTDLGRIKTRRREDDEQGPWSTCGPWLERQRWLELFCATVQVLDKSTLGTWGHDRVLIGRGDPVDFWDSRGWQQVTDLWRETGERGHRRAWLEFGRGVAWRGGECCGRNHVEKDDGVSAGSEVVQRPMAKRESVNRLRRVQGRQKLPAIRPGIWFMSLLQWGSRWSAQPDACCRISIQPRQHRSDVDDRQGLRFL